MKIIEKFKEIPNYFRKNKILVIILMIFVFLYLINQDIFLNIMYKKIKYKNSKIMVLTGKLEKLKNETSSISFERNSLSSVQNSIANLNREFKNEESMLPQTFMVSEIIRQISNNSPSSNFIIQNINFGKHIKTKEVQALPFTISAIGGFGKLIKFIKNINSLKRIVVVNYVSIKASKKSFPNIKATIKGIVFSMKGSS